MNLQQYREQRQKWQDEQFRPRCLCQVCLQPDFSCYCAQIEKIDSGIQFVILIHPIEFRRRIATGRMSHLCLQNSQLITGQDYSANAAVNKILQDPDLSPVVLYPGPTSMNLSTLNVSDRQALFPANKKPVIFVIDGTWATARKMIRLSRNLAALPRICFTPERPSNFRVRKQPGAICYSTIEAIHQVIELIGADQGFATASREHDKLLKVFDFLVEKQLLWVGRSRRRATRKSRISFKELGTGD